MWIIPKTLQWSSGALDTEAFISDLNEQSQACASSLMVRSKPSPARTWLQKWRRDSWTQHLSGRILKPSHAKSFATEWTSLWQVILASPSAQQGSDSAQKTLATSGPTSPDQLELFAPASASLKMSKDTSPSDSERSLESWNKLVTQRRGEYSLRVKSVRRTSASGSSSWPTIRASEYKDTGPIGSKSHDHMLGKGYLCAVVTQDAANWLTPQSGDATGSTREAVVMWANGQRPKTSDQRLRTQVAAEELKHGQAAPASPSTDGSRPESSEQSQRNWQTFAHGTHNRGETPHRQVVKALVSGGKAQTQCLTVDQVFAEEIKGTNTKSWATPRAGKTTDENPETWALRQAKGDVATMPLTAQVKVNATGKLNPRWVETLMGLPVGWVMPSCKSPVTIAPTNSDSLATELSQPPQRELFEF
jgi:hypothetical protein